MRLLVTFSLITVQSNDGSFPRGGHNFFGLADTLGADNHLIEGFDHVMLGGCFDERKLPIDAERPHIVLTC